MSGKKATSLTARDGVMFRDPATAGDITEDPRWRELMGLDAKPKVEPKPEVAAHLFTCVDPAHVGLCTAVKDPHFEELHPRKGGRFVKKGGVPTVAPKKAAKKAVAKAVPKPPAKKAAAPRKAAAPKKAKPTPAEVAQAFQGVKAGDLTSDQLEPQVKGLTSPQLDALAVELRMEGWKPRATKAAKVAAVMQVARGVEDANAIMGRSAAKRTSLSPRAEAWKRAAEKLALRGEPAETAPLAAGTINVGLDILTYPDGAKALRKKMATFGQRSAEQQADAEELASLTAAAFGLDSPAVHRESSDTVLMDYVPGKTGMDTFNKQRVKDSRKGKMVGLFDAIIENEDRNDGNYIVGPAPDYSPSLIDHGFAWPGDIAPDQPPYDNRSIFLKDLVENTGFGTREYKEMPYTQNDLNQARDTLEGLRPEFDRRGRSDWLDRSLARVEALRTHATGTEDLFL